MFLRSLRAKFIIYLIPLIFFISLSFLGFLINRSNYLIEQELVELGSALVRNLSYSSELAVASEDEFFLKPYLEGISKEKDVVLVTVYNKKGFIIASNKKVEIEEKMPGEIKEKALRERSVLKRESYTQKGDKIYDFYSPIFISKTLTLRPEAEIRELSGFARVGLSLERIENQSRTIFIMGLGITALLILLGFGISFFLAARMTKPIKQLTEGVEIIGKGNLDHWIEIKTGDELEELGRSFNKMAQDLKRSQAVLEEEKTVLEIKVKARTKELQELAEGLEDEVKRRTAEAQERMKELERFHKLAVGRELKMIELKKEIKKLKEELKKYKKKM